MFFRPVAEPPGPATIPLAGASAAAELLKAAVVMALMLVAEEDAGYRQLWSVRSGGESITH